MKAENIKNALLEYIVRQLLQNCGFENVYSENSFFFHQERLCYVYGKKAVFATGIKINPQIKIPFEYPIQLFFECNSVKTNDSVSIVRTAIELREDVNQLEMVAHHLPSKEQNLRRNSHEIEKPIYQVGAALLEDYSESAAALATKNRIPILSLSWFLEPKTLKKFNTIDQELIDYCNGREIQNLYDFFKDARANLNDPKYSYANAFLNSSSSISSIVASANNCIRYTYTGFLETGEMVFLQARSRCEETVINQQNPFIILKGEMHGCNSKPNVWRLSVYNQRELEHQTDFDFYVPQQVFSNWKSQNPKQSSSLKVFIFNKKYNPELPFSIITIDREWLDKVV